MDKAKLLDRYEKGLSSKGKNRTLFLRYAREFLDYGDGKMDKVTVQGFLKHLKEKNYSAGTIKFAFQVVRTLFRRNEEYWPFNRGEGPTKESK